MSGMDASAIKILMSGTDSPGSHVLWDQFLSFKGERAAHLLAFTGTRPHPPQQKEEGTTFSAAVVLNLSWTALKNGHAWGQPQKF